MNHLRLFTAVMALALGVFACGTMAKEQTLLDQTHFAKGIKCASCHGTAEPRQAVTMSQCVKCHNTSKVAAATADLKPTNPHNNRHFSTETNCTNCHHVHQASENYCAGCHPRFDFVVP